MKKFVLCNTISLVPVCAALCSNVYLCAREQVPFKGYFIPIVTSTTPVDATHVRLQIDVQVQATHLFSAISSPLIR